MALHGKNDVNSSSVLSMKRNKLCGREMTAKPLVQIATHTVVNNLCLLLQSLPQLPRNLKARVLYLMSKRNNLLNDKTLPMICSDAVRELDFTNTAQISDAGLLSLPFLPSLYKIDLNDTRTGTRDSVTSSALKHVASVCPNIRIAYFRRCINVCDDGVEALAKGCKGLRELNLSGCTKITDRSTHAVASHCPHLTNLNLAYTNITDESPFHLTRGVCLQQLQEVHISHCQKITDEGVEALLHGASNVSYLEIQGCPLLTGSCISALDQLRDKFDLKQFNFTIPF